MPDQNWVKFYLNNNYGRYDSTFQGPGAKPYGVSSGIDSLQTSDNGWLIVFNEENYQGDWHKFPGGSGANEDNKDDPAHDLNKVNRGSDGDWKNQIKSFVIYDDRQYWDAYEGGELPLPLDGHEDMYMMSSGSYLGGTWTRIDVSGQYEDVQEFPGYIPNSFATGDKMWLTIFDQTNYQGHCHRIENGQRVGDLLSVQRGASDNWGSATRSVRSANARPRSWDLAFSGTTFINAYANPDGSFNGAGDSFTYQTQDASYRMKYPILGYPSGSEFQLTMNLDYMVTMASDMHMTLACLFDDDGNFISAAATDMTTSEAYQIPDWLVKGVDATVEIAGALGAIETLGISEEAAQFVVGVFDVACEAFNVFANAMSLHSLDDGGQYYMVPMCAHTIVRMAASLTDEGVLVYPDDATKKIAFSGSGFANALAGDTGVSITSGMNDSNVAWNQWSGTSGNLNQYFEYSYQDHDWRQWHPESTLFPTGVGMLASCKIDFVRGSEQDDHILLLVGFLMDDTLQPVANFAQASVKFGGDSDLNIVGQPVTSGDIAQGVADSLSAIIDADDFGIIFDSTDGRQDIPQITKMAIEALIASMSAE